MYKRLFASAVIFGMAAIAPPAHAQARCVGRDALVAGLEKRYAEAQIATGLQSNGVLIEIWASPTTGTWTIFLTDPEGIACVTSSGEGLALGLLPNMAKGVAG
ncbi:hypothetical protein RXV86_11140 [Alisedimentitalea sp. MJ-SS2]|uniref:hypothetical protein n=1 Tax=Aliisedimentitalea sp. MJ-SS2 TaxID=3049795 RepID=UPI002909FC99|nr:hypothetical protein [Alisedimentitalea sp. MJ-SS2]MDU8927939.1 hypothetical protein [Alisedimentitalea sp. MJ-SS2]